MPSNRATGSLSSWLLQIAYREFLQSHRRSHRYGRRTMPETYHPMDEDWFAERFAVGPVQDDGSNLPSG